MTRLTDAERAELRRLAEAATPGPWLAATGSGSKRRRQQYALLGVESLRGQGEKGAIAVFAGLNEHRADDAEFCAAARTGVLELLDALDGVEAVLEVPDDVQEWERGDGSVRRVAVVDVARVRAAISGTREDA